MKNRILFVLKTISHYEFYSSVFLLLLLLFEYLRHVFITRIWFKSFCLCIQLVYCYHYLFSVFFFVPLRKTNTQGWTDMEKNADFYYYTFCVHMTVRSEFNSVFFPCVLLKNTIYIFPVPWADASTQFILSLDVEVTEIGKKNLLDIISMWWKLNEWQSNW